MELADKATAVFEVTVRLPGWGGFTNPLDEVLELSVMATGVENVFNFIFDFVVDNNRRWWRNDLARKRICSDRFQKGDVENWMYFHSRRKVQLISVGADTFQNLESAKSLEVEFSGGALCPDVTRKQPDFIADLEIWRSAAVFISLLGVSCISPLDLSHDVLFQVPKLVDK